MAGYVTLYIVSPTLGPITHLDTSTSKRSTMEDAAMLVGKVKKAKVVVVMMTMMGGNGTVSVGGNDNAGCDSVVDNCPPLQGWQQGKEDKESWLAHSKASTI